MALLEFEAVLEFLRKNGLSHSESALMEDVKDNSHLFSSDFHKFFFPMPPPPTIPSEGSCSSDDEFLSLTSAAPEFCPSDFANPCGIQIGQPASEASSDTLSQFGTARDYSDFDMQNDQLWDDNYSMPPSFIEQNFDGNPTEDKFMMAVQTEETVDNELETKLMSEGSTNHLSNKLALVSEGNLKYESCKDYYELGEKFPPHRSDNECGEDLNNYSCSALLCACCGDAGRVYTDDIADLSLENLKLTDLSDLKLLHLGEKDTTSVADIFNRWSSTDVLTIGLSSTDNLNDLEKESKSNENDLVTTGEQNRHEAAPDEEGSAMSDKLVIDNDKEDDYEVFDLRIIHRKNRTGFEENKELPIVLNSVIAGRYYITEFLGSAAFSRVVQAQDLWSGMDVCLKIIKNDKDFFDQSLDEIKLLKYVNRHDPADEHHILRLYDYFYHREHLFIVTELLRANLYEFQKHNLESGGDPYFTMARLQVIAQQCLEGLIYLHGLGIIHCDLKPENIVIKSYGRCEIKIIDLGSSCFETDNLSLYVQSRSYRAPEVMLGLPYDQKIDLWSIGCILAELYSGEVLFPNAAVVMVLARMVELLGPIDMDMLQNGEETHKYFTEDYDLYCIDEDRNEVEYIIPETGELSSLEHQLQISDPVFLDFLKYLLEINPRRRPTAQQALRHPWLSHPYYTS